MPKSNRLLVFQALRRGALPRGKLCDEIGMDRGHGQMGIILRSEVAHGRIKKGVQDNDGKDETVYSLTAKGRKHLDEGKIDSYSKEHRLVAVGRNEEKGT